MPRILGIDYGEKRIGLALSDESGEFAFEYEIWPAGDFFKKIAALIAEKEIKKIVLGMPLNLKGAPTQKTAEVLKFKDRMAQTLPDCPIEFSDERLSSQMAESISGQRKNIDALAAQILLQNYLNKNSGQNGNKASSSLS